jgi:hypothetical protein
MTTWLIEVESALGRPGVPVVTYRRLPRCKSLDELHAAKRSLPPGTMVRYRMRDAPDWTYFCVGAPARTRQPAVRPPDPLSQRFTQGGGIPSSQKMRRCD